MLNTTTDLKSVGQSEYTDTMTSTSFQNKDRALAVLEVKSVSKTVFFTADNIHNSNKAECMGGKGKATVSSSNEFHRLWKR